MRNLILSALLLAAAFQTAMGQAVVEGQWTYIVEYPGVTITESTATGAVTIPSVLGGYVVKRVGMGRTVDDYYYNIFSRPDLVTSVIIPWGVSTIGAYAFAECINLAGVGIGRSVTSIEPGAFMNCPNLNIVIIPNNVTSIGQDAFLYYYDYYNPYDPSGTPMAVYLPARFATTYTNFGLTASQVSFYYMTSPSYSEGQYSVIANPNTYDLYTTSQIQNMAIGDLVLTKNVGGTFTLNYEIEKSADLQTWTLYQALSLPLTGLPTDKAFVRIRAK